MIKNWLITGDCHRDFTRFSNLYFKYDPKETAIIIIGDSGINFYGEAADALCKNVLADMGYTFYIVRGNHDMRPSALPGIERWYDAEAGGYVLFEKKWPAIRYLIDGQAYDFAGTTALVIGGAYSVDKNYRLSRGLEWFPDEQLTAQEMIDIERQAVGKSFNLILSHTCPLKFQPTDKFLSFIDQSTVDNSMENWMEQLRTKIKFDCWCFGHYHLERYDAINKYRIFYYDIVELDKVQMV